MHIHWWYQWSWHYWENHPSFCSELSSCEIRGRIGIWPKSRNLATSHYLYRPGFKLGLYYSSLLTQLPVSALAPYTLFIKQYDYFKKKAGLYHFCAHGFPISFKRLSLLYLPLCLHLLILVSWFPPLQPQWPCWCPGAVQARSCPGPFHLFPLPRTLSPDVHVAHSLATFDPCSEITFLVMPSQITL